MMMLILYFLTKASVTLDISSNLHATLFVVLTPIMGETKRVYRFYDALLCSKFDVKN